MYFIFIKLFGDFNYSITKELVEVASRNKG